MMAERFGRLHLLTFRRFGFHQVENSRKAAEALREKFAGTELVHRIIDIDRLFCHLAYDDYLSRIRRFGFFMLQNCTFCALANHLRTLAYCLRNGITHVADGVTRELAYLPSHMEKPIDRLKIFYEKYGITYHTPVYDFDIPREMNFFDRLALRDEATSGVVVEPGKRTTGRYLHERGLMPAENIKGSGLDRKLQYRCFQYVLHNMVAFWAYLPGKGRDYSSYEREILRLYDDRLAFFAPLLDELASGRESAVLRRLLGEEER